MEEGQAKNGFKPPVVSETVVESETVVSKGPVVSDKPVFKDNKKKMSGGVIACIIILAVLAIGGIGFGVWAMLSQNDKIASLETDLKNCANSNNSENGVETVTCPDGTEIEVTDDAASEAINPEDYIYIGEWGIRIKMPEKLKYISYSYDNYISDGNNEYSEDYSIISFNGIAADSDKTAAKEYLRQAVTNNCYVAGVARVSKGESRTWGKIVYEDDKYNYVYSHSQVACSDGTNDSTLAETEGNALIIEMLTNKENYSKI